MRQLVNVWSTFACSRHSGCQGGTISTYGKVKVCTQVPKRHDYRYRRLHVRSNLVSQDAPKTRGRGKRKGVLGRDPASHVMEINKNDVRGNDGEIELLTNIRDKQIIRQKSHDDFGHRIFDHA